MADLFRDSPFGQILRLYFLREIAPFEDERPGFKPHKTVSRQLSLNCDSDSDSGVYIHHGKQHRSKSRTKSEVSVTTVSAKSATVNIVAFLGPHDRDDPHNWTFAKKALVIGQMYLLTFTVYSASAIVAPAAPNFMEQFGASQQTASLTISMYVIGYGLGPLLFSPLSEMSELGRNLNYMSSLLLFIIVTAIAAWISNFPAFIVLRFLQGFFGGPVLATGAATAADLFAVHKVPYAVAVWAMFAFAGPALGPVVSGFAISLGTWRWSMWETFILSIVTFVFLFFCFPETNGEYILAQRAKRIRIKTQDLTYQTQAEVNSAQRKWGQLVPYHLTMPFRVTVQDPAVLAINVYTGLVYSIFYSFFESFPLVYNKVYGFSIGISSLVYLSVLIGGSLGLFIYLLVVKSIFEPFTLKHGVSSPEFRLVPGVWAALFQPIGLFIFAFTSKSDITWVAPTVGVCVYLASAFLLINVIFVYLPLGYPRYAASIFAANGFFRSVMACSAIHFAHPLFDNLGIANGVAILGALNGMLGMIFLAIYRFGPWLRSKSKFAN